MGASEASAPRRLAGPGVGDGAAPGGIDDADGDILLVWWISRAKYQATAEKSLADSGDEAVHPPVRMSF